MRSSRAIVASKAISSLSLRVVLTYLPSSVWFASGIVSFLAGNVTTLANLSDFKRRPDVKDRFRAVRSLDGPLRGPEVNLFRTYVAR
jgi:hypothetical protein